VKSVGCNLEKDDLMPIKLVRVDDRLVHGQVVLKWTRAIGANMILVADDIAANDVLQQTLMRVAAPPGIQLEVHTIADAANKLNSGEWKQKEIFVIVRNPITLLKFVNEGAEIEYVNVGNAGGGEGKTRLTKQVAATQEELSAWHSLNEKNIKLEVQWVPGEKKDDLNQILNKLE
jgi:mannose/fructose/N-acetylgalactosamine-specific phosphotransferase system component IIB